MTPNKRVKVYDAADVARNMAETFKDRDVQEIADYDFDWPAKLQHIGDSYGVAYSSDKWKDLGDLEIYKHVAESRNRVFALPGFMRDADNPRKAWPVIGPMIDFTAFPMPKDFAELALFEEVNLRLHLKGTNDDPKFAGKDDGFVTVTVSHGMLGGGMIRWSKTKRKSDQSFLFIYTERDGVQMIITGDELAVEADGITG